MVVKHLYKGDGMAVKKEILNLTDFQEKELELDNIFLDPNNPRFAEKGRVITEDRIIEQKVQEVCMDNISEYDTDELIDSIKTIGFLTIDKVVVRPIKNSVNNYVVVEGNRRIAALKKIKEEYLNGEIKLRDDILKSILKFNVLVYTGREESIAWIIQGIRHISGVKNWRPYQQVKLLSELIEKKNIEVSEAAKAIGIGSTTATRLIRSYNGYKQCLQDEEFGDLIAADTFSYFQDGIFFKRNSPLQLWLGWNETEKMFKNEERLKKFLKWILVKNDKGEYRIPSAIDLRNVLNKAIEWYPELFKKFEASEDQTISNLQYQIWKMEEEPKEIDEWLSALKSLTSNLEGFPIIKIKAHADKNKEAKELASDLKRIVEEIIKALD